MTQERTGYAEFRNQTFMDFGVVATTSMYGQESREFIKNSDVFDTALQRHNSHTFYFPLERSDNLGPQFVWDPLKEDQMALAKGEPLVAIYKVPEALREFNEYFPDRLRFGLVAHEIGVKKTGTTQVLPVITESCYNLLYGVLGTMA